MSLEMREFIFAIFATFVVVVSANKRLLEAVTDKKLWLVKILLHMPRVNVDFTTRIPSTEESEGMKIANPLLQALEFYPFDRKAEDITMALIKAGANPNAAAYTNGSTALNMACIHGCINVVIGLLKRNADIEAVHPVYGRPLNIAISKGHTELALLLIKDHKPDLEAKTPISLRTPLQQACCYENVAVIKALLDKKVNFEDFDKYGDTAMHLAAAQGNVEIMTILRERGANVNFGNGIKPPLHAAVSFMNAGRHLEKNLEAAKILIESFGAEIDAADDKGYSALHIATMDSNWKMIVLLIAHGADHNLKNEDGETPNDIAIKMLGKNLQDIYDTKPK